MGVSGLLGLLKSIQKPCNLKAFSGKTMGVDAYGWLHRAAIPCAVDLAMGKPTTRLVDFAMHRVRMLIHFGVTPYLVFDGDHLPSKAGTEKARAERRKESRAAGLELLRLGKITQAHQELQKAVDITPELARQLIDELKRNRIQYVVAPYEADSQLAYLERKGIVDGIISEDSDLLVFGAKCLLTKLDQYGDCVMIRQEDFTACREVSLVGWTCVDFRRMAILSGCDYLDGIHKMGLKTAYRLVRKYKTTERIIRSAQLEGKFHIPAGYMESFTQAEMTFLYQWVYCPHSRCLVNLTEPETDDQLAGITYIGEYVEPETARRIAVGDFNPMTKLPIIVESLPASSRKTPLLTKAMSLDSSKSQSIESFFKPKRVPLAEIDPNTFTPSPSQHRLLQQNAGRVWPSNEAASRPLSASFNGLTNLQEKASDKAGLSAPHPHKRQRLCQDENELPTSEPVTSKPSERSRFFAFSAPDPSQSLARGTHRKKSKKLEINIWSDDSLEDAMAALPDTYSSSLPSVTTSKSSHSSKISVLEDEPPPIMTGDNPVATPPHDESSETIETNAFSASLLAQTRALRECFGYKSKPSHTQTSTTHTTSINTPPIEPATPPHTQTLAPGETQKSPQPTLAAASTIPETPLAIHRKRTSELAPSPRGDSEGRITESPCTTGDIRRLGRVTLAKGSEDLLVIPDSEAESEGEVRDGVGGSPVVIRVADDDGENGGAVRRLDLRRFAFAIGPW